MFQNTEPGRRLAATHAFVNEPIRTTPTLTASPLQQQAPEKAGARLGRLGFAFRAAEAVSVWLARVAVLIALALDWFVPPALRREADEYQRARMFVLGHVFGTPLGLIVLAYLHVLDPSPGWHWWIITGSITAFLALPFALRWSGRLTALSYVTVQHFEFVILYGSYEYGGVSSPFLCWLLTVPLFALFYLGQSPRLRAAVLAGLAVYLAGWYGLQVGGFPPPEHVPLPDLSGVGIVSLFCATLFVSMMSLYYARVVASTRAVQELNAELESRVLSRTRELEHTRREVISRLAAAGEFRDSDTGQHVLRMSHYAHHLARAAGVSEAEAAMIRDAAPLHDIGKIGIPDSILLKPGPLDPAEWEIMKRHTLIGGEILAGSGFPLLDLARIIALTHHERWDGDGYPNGLRGQEIPFAGRVVAIADVFDATTCERPYRRRRNATAPRAAFARL
jgi:hypothetical protein